MKTIIRLSILTFFIGFFGLLTSCEEMDLPGTATGSLKLAISVPGDQLKSDSPDSTDLLTYHAMLTVVNSLGEPVMEDELIPLYKFGNEFISERVELKVGRYQLTRFLVINPYGEVIYAAPIEGSPRAYLVKDPLPVAFSILPEELTHLAPEVLAVLNGTPSDFGYATFSFDVVKPLPFYIMAVIDNPLIMAPTVITDAWLAVYSPDGWSHEFYLEARVNRIVIRGGVRYYTFVLKKEGYEPQKFEIPAEKLLATTKENPLVIKFSNHPYQVLTLQPGPEDGMDAMIANLEPDNNYGDHPYFEATFLSDSILTVMRSTRSLTKFSLAGLPKSARIEKVVLTLHYDLLAPWDSIYMDSIIYYQDPTTNSFAWYGAVLQQVVEPWGEYDVTWNTQPTTIEANQVYVPPFYVNPDWTYIDAAGNVNATGFINVDVTRLFVPEQEIAAPNYGMMLKLWPSEQFPGLRFASSDYRVPEMRPLLKVFYIIPTL
jgi:hypothetical protein